MIRSAKMMESWIAELSAGLGRVLSSWASFRAARMLAAMSKTLFLPSPTGVQYDFAFCLPRGFYGGRKVQVMSPREGPSEQPSDASGAVCENPRCGRQRESGPVRSDG